MKFPRRFKVQYIAFTIPLILALLSWMYFPVLAAWIINKLFGYTASEQVANPIWYWLLRFFYSWYTFLAIGVTGIWIVAAFFARKQHTATKPEFYPMVSFVVPAYNEEKSIANCMASLFKCAENYQGNCEIIVVDDGSTDYTYERLRSRKNASYPKPESPL